MWNAGLISWNQDCWEKYQQSQICRWYHPNNRKWRLTKEPPDEGERRQWKSWLKLNIQKTKIMAPGPFTSLQIGKWKQWQISFLFLISHAVISNFLWPPWTAACQASLSFTISQSSLKLVSTESMISSNHLILCHPFLLLPSIFPSTRVFSNESDLHIRWPKHWSFSFSISPIFRADFL